MDRQIVMIDSAARSMQEMLLLPRDEALDIITRALLDELGDRNTRLENVLRSSKAEQTAFLRGVVGKVEASLRQKDEYDEDAVSRGIQKIMKIWHESWSLGTH
ncbi:MAG: hypothetical protein KDK37_10050 [Leptospiraceae bacterium]|nr:hypothetical protein [Leptospiraceae bacterium]MCB1304612.1 hypothetical protein [Leptospiraceae bacterium]